MKEIVRANPLFRFIHRVASGHTNIRAQSMILDSAMKSIIYTVASSEMIVDIDALARRTTQIVQNYNGDINVTLCALKVPIVNEREERLVTAAVSKVVDARLTRQYAQQPDIQKQAALQLRRSEGRTKASLDQIAISIASKRLNRVVRDEFQDQFGIETLALTQLIQNGTYDASASSPPKKDRERTDTAFKVQTHLNEFLKQSLPFGVITLEDTRILFSFLPPITDKKKWELLRKFLADKEIQSFITNEGLITPQMLQRYLHKQFRSNSNNLTRSSDVNHSAEADIGNIHLRTDIPSTIREFSLFPEYKIQYPQVVITALAELFQEYNVAFQPLLKANIEWENDYRYCLDHGRPVNYFVQIDMVGLDGTLLDNLTHLDKKNVKELLRKRIFEIENSLAMYNLMEQIFAQTGKDSLFKRKFRSAQDKLRQKYKMPIALLAVTDEKYEEMKASEFGKHSSEELTDAEVHNLSGFNRFFGPTQFREYLQSTQGFSEFLLNVRASDPVSLLKNRSLRVENPLLADTRLRKIIKEYAITFNLDNPEWDSFSHRRINDTKEYLHTVGMAWEVTDLVDIYSPPFLRYLLSHEIAPDMILSGDVMLRAKPALRSYGSYGHLRGRLGSDAFAYQLGKSLLERGPYVIQPEKKIPS